MGYREDAGALKRLVQADRVHRAVYTDAELFQLEMERLWSRTWIYVGHASQIPNAGDFLTLDVATQPVIVVRHSDDSVRVLENRCAHKGTKVVYAPSGSAGKPFAARTTPGPIVPTVPSSRCPSGRVTPPMLSTAG